MVNETRQAPTQEQIVACYLAKQEQ
jgi:hypothetical protein